MSARSAVGENAGAHAEMAADSARPPQADTRHALRALTVVAVLVALIMALSSPAPSSAEAPGRVRGAIVQAGVANPRVDVTWFTDSWDYLGTRSTSGGAYSLSLPPGTYWLQFTDRRPAYDVEKSSPTDVKVTVRAGSSTVKSVRMRRGAALGGQVTSRGSSAGGARVVAANTLEQSFETRTDQEGNFALGGLPPGKYSVFTYDRTHRMVAKSLYAGMLKARKFKPVRVRLNKRAGTLLVDVYAGDRAYPGTAYVTAVSASTGQFWTERLRGGTVTFKGLYPGRYTLQVPGVGNFLSDTLAPRARVRPGKAAFGSVRLTRTGGSVTARVVGANKQETGLSGATVRLYDVQGRQVGPAVTTASDGSVLLGGQLATQRGMAVVVDRGPYSKFLANCIYDPVRAGGIAVTSGRRTVLGDLVMPLSSDPEQPQQCKS